jgi:hypothetical protein
MAKSDSVPVRSGEEESALLFPGRDADETVDMTDKVNAGAFSLKSPKKEP